MLMLVKRSVSHRPLDALFDTRVEDSIDTLNR